MLSTLHWCDYFLPVINYISMVTTFNFSVTDNILSLQSMYIYCYLFPSVMLPMEHLVAPAAKSFLI